MKTAIHPQYYSDCQVVCACGHTFVTGSTKPSIRTEICAKCHPFFTGTQKFVDTIGKVQKFQTQQKTAAAKQQVLTTKKKAKQETEDRRPKSLRGMLLSNPS